METAWGAYQLDLVVLIVGRKIEQGLQKGENIEMLLQTKKKSSAAGSTEFASLKTPGLPKVKIVNGVW